MANIQSSKKDIRRTKKRNSANSKNRTRIRTFDKKIRHLVDEGSLEEATVAFKTYSSLLDRAGKTNLIHHRQADRRKSRIAKFLASVAHGATSAPSTESPAATTTEETAE